MPQHPQGSADQFTPHSIGKPFIELQSVDSTNNYARSLLEQGLAEHGVAIFAHEQFAGLGQRGKVWNTEKGANIILSAVINPRPLIITQQFLLSATIALSVRDFFAKYAGDDTKIKWPNDLYWQDKKAGGILISNRQQAIDNKDLPIANSLLPVNSWAWSIIGMGININQVSFPASLPNPVSLKQITGKQFDPVELAKELCGLINKNFLLLVNGGFEDIYAAYLLHLYKRNETVNLKKENRVFEATIKSVSRDGQLIVQHAFEERFDFGEVAMM